MADFSLQDLALSLALQTGMHPYGHVGAGAQLDVPVDIDWRTRTEKWNTPDRRKDAEINAGGFALQDLMASLMGTPEASTANALYKIGYMSGLTLPKGTQGDIKNLERLSGNNATEALVALSILGDLIKAKNPKSNWSTQFIAPEGAPGLQFTTRW